MVMMIKISSIISYLSAEICFAVAGGPTVLMIAFNLNDH